MRGNHHPVIPLFLALSLVAPTCEAVEYAGGTGEPNDPYLIATAEQFLAADFGVPGTYFRLCCNIDLGRKDPLPRVVRAHVDGAGFEIQHAIGAMGGGIFNAVGTEGTITNLTLVNFDIGSAAWHQDSEDFGTVGGLAAGNLGTISNCAAIGWISTRKRRTVGGLVGVNDGSIINCYFEGWVGASSGVGDIEDEVVPPGVGGLVGHNTGLISNSFARGFVVGDVGVGGLVGYNNGGTISTCYSACMVIGTTGAGGLVSINRGSLRHCYASGRVTGQMRGGLVGMAGQYAGSATNCLWDIRYTDCVRSGAGMGLTLEMWPDPARNGWTGDPNWVMSDDWSTYDSFPRLAWEGTVGKIIGEYPWLLFREGSGTRSDPYVIRTRDDLRNLCRASICWDKHFVLANDLDDVGTLLEFSPIGICSGSSFSGTFDGNGHVIRRLWVDAETIEGEATAWNLGLFGYVTGEVRNLVLENCHFAGGVNSCRVGTLVGTSEGVIENCSATGSITVGEKSRYVGGLIGFDIGRINDCEATVTIKAGEGSTYVGDLVGVSDPPPHVTSP